MPLRNSIRVPYRLAGLFFAVVFAGAGCSTQRLQERLLPTERAVQPTANAFECGSGSVRSAIAACRAEGGRYGHCALVASRAGVSDATACYTYAATIHRRREQLVGEEDQLAAQTAYLQDVNADTGKLNSVLTARVNDVVARTDLAVESVARGEMTASELDQLHAILDVEVTSATRQLDAGSRELQAAEQYRSKQQPPTAALDAEIARLRALLDDVQRQTGELVAQRQRI